MQIKIIEKPVKDELVVFFKSEEDMQKNPYPDFKGKFEESLLSYSNDQIPRKLFLGLGESNKIDKEKIRKLVSKSLDRVHSLKLKTFSIEVPKIQNIENSDITYVITEALILGDYSFDKYKTDKEKLRPKIEVVHLLTPNITLQGEVNTAKIICDNTNLVRDLVNECSHVATSIMLAKKAKDIADELGIRCTIFDENDLTELGMGLILGVSRAAPHGPRFVILEYKGNPQSYERIALVGKGITFDSGGLNIKTGDGMLTMKCDMAGAATVLGILKTAAELKLKVNLIGAMPLCENSVGPNAYRPGDILISYSKKTVEIGNTDAEGRLVLADAIAYVEEKFKPNVIITLATLTGSCIRTFGEQAAGLFTRNDELSKKLMESGFETFERVWPLPMFAEYEKEIESKIADLSNVGSKGGVYAGATTAATFLQLFVKEVPFVHFDIAGTAWAEKKRHYVPEGGTGFGVRLITHFISKDLEFPKTEKKKPEEKLKKVIEEEPKKKEEEKPKKKTVEELREEEEKRRPRVEELIEEELENPMFKSDLPDVFPKI